MGKRNKLHLNKVLSAARNLLLLLLLTFSGGGSSSLIGSLTAPGSVDATNTSAVFRMQDAWVDSVLNTLSYEEKIAQLIVPYCKVTDFTKDTVHFAKLYNLVKELKVGGFIVAGGNVSLQIALLDSLQSLAKVPLLISADYERGAGQKQKEATVFPYMMAFGAVNDSLLAYKAASYIARETRLAGVHQNYAPVSDINSNPDNPIINNRSFGEDKQLVSRLTGAFLKGYQDNKVIATVKHFPGHGNTSIDSHKEPVVLHQNSSEIYNTDLIPFKTAINQGVMSIMTGHLSVPAFDTSRMPATLSYPLTTDLLKRELGFEGLIVTDALGMQAISSKWGSADAAVLSFLAGSDILLLPDDPYEAFNGLVTAYREGKISVNRLDNSVKKILTAKRWAGLNSSRTVSYDEFNNRTPGAEDLAAKIARKSITLIKNDLKLLPFKSTKKFSPLHIALSDGVSLNAAEDFHALLKERKINATYFGVNSKSKKREYSKISAKVKKDQPVILSVYTKIHTAKGSLGPDGLQAEFIKSLVAKTKNLIVLVHGSPYIVSIIPKVKTVITNYGETPCSETALADAVCGIAPVSGKLPVSIPGTNYKAGSGLLLGSENDSPVSGDESYNNTVLDSLIQQGISDSVSPAFSVLVMKDGVIKYKKAFGHFTYNPQSAVVDTSSIFDLASVSKVIATTTAVMICLDRGLFTLDDRVAGYIPAFAAAGKENVTIKNLLLHNSGLPAFKQYYKLVKTEDEVLSDIYSSKLDYNTGDKTVYSDLGMITMGKIIEKVTGKTLDKFCRDEIFDPLGMSNTLYAPPAEIKERCVPTEIDTYWRKRLLQGEVHDEASAMLHGVAGHAGLFSTTGDLSKLLFMLLNKGVFNGKRYITEQTVDLFTKRFSSGSSRALGWDTKTDEKSSAGKYFSLSSYGHTGYTGTSVWTDPETGLIVILLTNRVHPTRDNPRLGKFRPQFHNAVFKQFVK